MMLVARLPMLSIFTSKNVTLLIEVAEGKKICHAINYHIIITFVLHFIVVMVLTSVVANSVSSGF